jgi:sugar transferase (PEP-CTERM/EpsH1 system associated)
MTDSSSADSPAVAFERARNVLECAGAIAESSRPKLLYLVHRMPYPPDKGDRIRNFQILSWLAERASVHLMCLADETVDVAAVSVLETLADRVAVVRLPALQRYARAACSVALGRTATEGAFESPAFRELLRRWSAETRYHVVLVSSSSMVQYLRINELSSVPKVVDFIDVDSQKWLDYAQACSGPRAWFYRTEARRLQRLERDAAACVRAALLVSEAESNLFRLTCDAPNVRTVSIGIDLAKFHAVDGAVDSDRTCVFVGALDYRPNVDGVTWFCREAWPEIYRQRSAARLLLVGRQPVAAVSRLAGIAGVEVIGQVPDVRPYLAEAGVVVVPLRLARGIQTKVLEALAMSKATVASPQSLAGLGGCGSVPALIASTPGEWIESVTRLMDDPAERRRLGQNGRRYVEEHHNRDRSLEPLGPILGLSAPSEYAAVAKPETLELER